MPSCASPAPATGRGPLGELIARAVKDGSGARVRPRQTPAFGGPLQLLPISALATRSLSALALRRAAERNALRAVRRPNGRHSTKAWVSAFAKARPRRRAPGGTPR